MAGTNEMGSVEGQLVGLPLAGPETFSSTTPTPPNVFKIVGINRIAST